MTDTKTKPARYDMLTNIPVTVDIKYVDVWPDKNGYGAQVSVKGTIDGETQTIYLKGKAWANLKALAEAGVIAGYEKEHEEPAEKVNIQVVAANARGVVLTRRQGPGERFANLVVETQGTVSRTAGVPTIPGKTASVRQPVDIGAPIPGLDEEELPPVEEAFPETAAVNPADARLAAQFKLYDTCFDHALEVATKAEKHGITIDLAAVCATLYIAANR